MPIIAIPMGYILRLLIPPFKALEYKDSNTKMILYLKIICKISIIWKKTIYIERFVITKYFSSKNYFYYCLLISNKIFLYFKISFLCLLLLVTLDMHIKESISV